MWDTTKSTRLVHLQTLPFFVSCPPVASSHINQLLHLSSLVSIRAWLSVFVCLKSKRNHIKINYNTAFSTLTLRTLALRTEHKTLFTNCYWNSEYKSFQQEKNHVTQSKPEKSESYEKLRNVYHIYNIVQSSFIFVSMETVRCLNFKALANLELDSSWVCGVLVLRARVFGMSILARPNGAEFASLVYLNSA